MYNLIIHDNHQTHRISVKAGSSLSSVLRAHGLSPAQPCAGRGVCGKCRVIAPQAPVTEADRAYIPPQSILQGVRLCCRIVVNHNLEITLPPEDAYTYKTLTAHAQGSAGGCAPNRVVLAADIGTTTIALALLDKDTGRLLASTSAHNPQCAFGADVMSRIAACVKVQTAMDDMRQSVWDSLTRLTVDLCKQAGLQPESPLQMTVAGNTAMLHILAGISPKGLACAPYRPAFLNSQPVTVDLTGALKIEAFLLPGISAFVGGDIVAAASACGLLKQEETSMLLDIGTNAEMLLCHNGKTYACSASAGPALEGGNISCGMPAVTGAVTGITCVNGLLAPQVIGGGEPKGLCGSGLVSVLASLLNLQLLTPQGGWNTSDEFEEYICMKNGAPAFHLTDTVYITTEDVQAFLLAKAAVAAGIDVLLSNAGLGYQDIRWFFLAGAFGANLELRAAVRTGLLAGSLSSSVHLVGDAALEGAMHAAIHPETIPALETFAHSAQHIELSDREAFSAAFMQHMLFP